MRFLGLFVVRRIRFEPGPDPVFIDFADCITQGAATADRPAKLDSQTAQNRFRLQISAGSGNNVFENLGNREVLHQRDHVGKAFVKSKHVGIGSFIELFMHAVQNRMRALVRDNVV